MSDSGIGWTGKTWNPITGCTKVSEGCRNCYAEKLSLRLQKMHPNGKYRNGFEVTIHPDTFRDPVKWKKPSLVFVNSMSDLFHSSISYTDIEHIFDVMEFIAPHHIYQILTKRPIRMRGFLKDRYADGQWPKNIWFGTSVEDAKVLNRIDMIRDIPGEVRFLSVEPMIGPLENIYLKGIDWVIVGGESGPGRRPLEESWVLDILDKCRALDIPFFFKQWGGARPGGDNTIDSRKIEEYPSAISWIQP